MSNLRCPRDRAALLLAAGRAAESLELRASVSDPTVTIATDELRELAEQFGRVVALLTALHLTDHLERAGVGAQPSTERPAA